MAGRRNKIIPVYRRRFSGPGLDFLYQTTKEKADRMVESKVAVLLDPKVGKSAGIVTDPTRQQRHSCAADSPASIEAAAVRAGMIANGERSQESTSEVVRYIRARSPYRWAQRPRITPRKKAA